MADRGGVATCDLVAADVTIVRRDGGERFVRSEHWRLSETPEVDLPFLRLLQA